MSTITINPGDPVLTKASAAGTGDVVSFAPGIHQSNSIQLRAGVKYLGTPGKTFWKFSAGGDFAMNVPPNLFIDGIMLENTGGLVLASKLDGANITRCGLKFDGTGNNAVGVRSTGGTTNTKIEQNYFHDSPNSFRDCDLWGVNGLSYSRNHFKNTFYGAHIIIADGVNKIIGNTGEQWDQMGLEVQDFGIVRGKGSVIFTDNVFSNWRPGTANSFGYSFGTQFVGSLLCENNYVALGKWDANGNYVEPTPRSNTRYGYYGEHGAFVSMILRNSKFVGSMLQITIMTANGQLENVSFHGWHQLESWAGDPVGTEGGNLGPGKWVSVINAQRLPITSADKPPRVVTGTPWDDGTTTTPPPPPMQITNAKAVASKDANNKDQVTLTWIAMNAAPGDQVNIVRTLKDGTTRDGDILTTAAVSGKLIDTRFTAAQVASKWEFQYAVGGSRTNLAQIGLGTVVTPPPPPPGTDYHVEEAHAYDVIGGKVTNETFKTMVVPK